MRLADVTDRSTRRLGTSVLSCLAVAGDGRSLILWNLRRPESDELWAQSFSADGVAGPREPIQGTERLQQLGRLGCGLDATGHGYASWVEYSADESRLLARRFHPQGWDHGPFLLDRQPYVASPGSAAIRIPHDLAVEEGGRALIAWIGEAGIRSGVAKEGVWTDAGLIEPRPFSDLTDVKIQGHGDLAVAAYARDYVFPEGGGRGMASYARFMGPSGWGPARRLGAAMVAGVQRPTLDWLGRSTVVTGLTRFPVTFLCVNRYDGGEWSDVSCDFPFFWGTSNPAGAPNGEVFALGLYGAEVNAVRWVAGVSEPYFETVHTGGERTTLAAAALSADGTSHAAWITDTRPWVGRAYPGNSWRAEPVPGARAAPSPSPCSSPLFGNGNDELRLAADARGNETTTWIEFECGTATLLLQRRTNDLP